LKLPVEFGRLAARGGAEPSGAYDSAVGPVDLHDVGEALWAVWKLRAAAQENLAVNHRLTGLGADESDGNAMARRAVRFNTAAIALSARITASSLPHGSP